MVSISPTRQGWTLDSIDWVGAAGDTSEDPESLFYLVAAASFLESTTDRYTDNLIAQFDDDDEIITWLQRYWLPEEMQHGVALRRYVEIVWPRFDWQSAYDSFLGEFEAHCCADELEPTRTREMASRCVVEMGTASYYTTLSRLAPDPVLATIARRIADDEVRHYKHFYRYFCRYQRSAPESRTAVFTALINRLRMINGQDSVIAVKHLYAARHPDETFDMRTSRTLRHRSRDLIRPHFPHRMCVQMLLKPLALGPRTRRIALPMTEMLARHLVP
jgi:hypothetical protein